MTAAGTSVSIVVCLLLAGCGGKLGQDAPGRDGSGGSAAGAVAGGAGGEAGAAGAGLHVASDSILVVDQNDVPIPGAIVVVDHSGGIEQQLTTHQGTATFPNVDFASEAVDITAFSPGRVLVTVLGVTPKGSRVLHLRPRRSAAQWTRVLTLKILNKVSSSDCLAVGLTTPSVHVATCDGSPQPDSIVLKTEPGTTGKIIAQDMLSGNTSDWLQPPMLAAFVTDIPSSGDAVDVDFAKPLPIEEASGTLAPFDSRVGCTVGPTTRSVASDVRAFYAFTPFVDNAGCHWKTAYVRAFPEADVETEYSECLDLLNVGVFQHGYFPSTAPPPLPDPIGFTSSGPGLFDPITWTGGSESPDRLIIWAHDDSAGLSFPVWTIWFPAGRDGVTLRKPPESIWRQLDWRDALFVFPGLEYCDPGAEQCGGRPCTPTDDPWCTRYVKALSLDTLEP